MKFDREILQQLTKEERLFYPSLPAEMPIDPELHAYHFTKQQANTGNRSVNKTANRAVSMYRMISRWAACAVLVILAGLPQVSQSQATASQTGESQVRVQWLEPASTLEQLTKIALQESNIVSDFSRMVARYFEIGERLSIVVGGGGVPDYVEESATLSIPYSFLSAVVRAQAEIVEDRKLALALGMDMVEYTLYHLFGHILIENLSAEADDDAEAISTWIMLTRWPNGGEQWFTSVQAFGKASQTLDGPLSDYWHAHSLYKSRQRKLECAILGSDPERYERLLSPVPEPDERRSQCVAAWNELDERMDKRLQPLMIQP